MVLEGKVNGKRLNAWLEGHAASRESYAGHTVFSIPSEGRTVRVARIGYDMVAISNTPTPEQIHSMLDRHRSAALPFAGSTLLAAHFHDVPLLAFAWGLGEIGLPFSESGAITVFGLKLPLEPDSTIVASVAPALSTKGLLRCRVEEIAPSDDVAARQAASIATLVTLARGVTVNLADNAANNALKDLLKTAKVNDERNRVVATATVSASDLTGLVTSENGSSGP